MTMLSNRLSKASMDYTCFGCNGECPIEKGTHYYRVVWCRDGKIETQRYCQRCHLALLNKMEHLGKKKGIQAERGAFRLNRLSSAFRKKWTNLCVELNSMSDSDREGKPGADLILSVAHDLTNGKPFKMESSMEEIAQNPARHKWHPAAKRLVVVRRQVRKLRRELDSIRSELVAANLKLRSMGFKSGIRRESQYANDQVAYCITRISEMGSEMDKLTEK